MDISEGKTIETAIPIYVGRGGASRHDVSSEIRKHLIRIFGQGDTDFMINTEHPHWHPLGRRDLDMHLVSLTDKDGDAHLVNFVFTTERVRPLSVSVKNVQPSSVATIPEIPIDMEKTAEHVFNQIEMKSFEDSNIDDDDDDDSDDGDVVVNPPVVPKEAVVDSATSSTPPKKIPAKKTPAKKSTPKKTPVKKEDKKAPKKQSRKKKDD